MMAQSPQDAAAAETRESRERAARLALAREEQSRDSGAQIRRLEAVGFRSWPSSTTSFDGTWAVRLTPDHPAKRLNSVNPLDPSDSANLDRRVERLGQQFGEAGRSLVFRCSPLSPKPLEDHLATNGFARFDETTVLRVALDGSRGSNVVKPADAATFLSISADIGAVEKSALPGLEALLSRVEGETGLFVDPDGQGAIMAVRHGRMVGIFELAVADDARGQGKGRRLLDAALAWGESAGASHGWLQVVAGNEAAHALYTSEGFEDVYRYAYWAARRDA